MRVLQVVPAGHHYAFQTHLTNQTGTAFAVGSITLDKDVMIRAHLPAGELCNYYNYYCYSHCYNLHMQYWCSRISVHALLLPNAAVVQQ
jgi:hypothetical protein